MERTGGRVWGKDPEYWTERLLLDINEEICAWMTSQKISRAELARRLGTSTAYITKMLNGLPNMTAQTLVRVALALDARPCVGFQPLAGKRTKMPRVASVPAGGGWEHVRPDDASGVGDRDAVHAPAA